MKGPGKPIMTVLRLLPLTTVVTIYGGFAGGETALNQRDVVVNKTVLSGDLDQNDGNSGDLNVDLTGDNALHVVSGAASAGATTVLDGFTISGGLATTTSQTGGGVFNSSSSPSMSNLIIRGNVADAVGGGVYNLASSPTLTNVVVSGNLSGSQGGGVANDGGSPSYINVVISGNSAGGQGGGVYNFVSSPTFTNVTVSGNSVGDSEFTLGGGVYSFGTPATFNNSMIWNNRAGGVTNTENASFNGDAAPNFQNSLVANATGAGIISSADPLFVRDADPASTPTTGGDFRLRESSPALDVGNNALNSTSADLAGNVRIQNTTIDLGPLEGELPACLPDMGPQPICVDVVSSGNFFDSGGAGGSYGDNENLIQTICSATDGEIVATFSALQTELGQDVLTVYDGSDTNAPLLGAFSGDTAGGDPIPGPFTSSNGLPHLPFCLRWR